MGTRALDRPKPHPPRALPGLLSLHFLALSTLGLAASCSASHDASTSLGGEAGIPNAGQGSAVTAGSAQGGGPAGASNGTAGGVSGGVTTIDGPGGATSLGAAGDAAGNPSAGQPSTLPSHAGTICDPQASYPAALPPAEKRTTTRLSEAFFFTEGPVWIASGGYLLFTDMYDVTEPPYLPGAHIRRFTPPSTFDTFITDSDTNGLALSADGLTLFAARRLKASADDGEIASYAIPSKAKATLLATTVNPNDLAARSDHNLYFSDGDVYRIDPSGAVSAAVRVDGATANGVTLSPDERTLYTGWSDGVVYASALGSPGAPGAVKPFATMPDAGHPDGMAVDCAGNLYVADYTHGAVQVFDSAGVQLGKLTLAPASGTSPAAEHATNVAFGGEDHRTLYVTGHRGDWSDPAVGELHSIVVNVPGLPY